jgi:wobble nucleotide-excising tRNase
LAFFLAVLKQDTDIGRKIVVFDDPFTSMDCFRRTWTEQTIRRVLQSAQQVIVLSHEAAFLNSVRMGVPDGEVKALQMRPAGQDNTVITEWDIEAATRSAYESHFRTLLAYRDTRTGAPLDVAKAIRPFLEELYRVRFPNLFPPAGSLGDFVVKARQAVSSATLQLDQSELDELEAINQYARQFQHGQSPTISENELHAFVRRALKLAGRC